MTLRARVAAAAAAAIVLAVLLLIIAVPALLDDLLALAREDAAAPLQAEPVRLADLAPDAHIEQDVWTSGERDALQRAVDNLVRNAHKHGEGAVTVTVGGDGTDAFIAVQDEGPGPSDPDRIFERFHRGPQARGEGSGLGLAIVRSIAERHGGHVEVDGARFALVLKAADAGRDR